MLEEYSQITLNDWMSWKEDIRQKLQETAQNFVYIGFRLKQIRDSKMFDGAADIFEFAQNEYGLGKSTVSRFIAINEKFSEGGNSLELKEEYKRFSSSKLSEMLTLPDNECQLITERTTIREIRELKNFSRQTIQFASDGSEIEYDPLQKCIIDFFKDKKKVLNEVISILSNDGDAQLAAELINPIEQTSHKKGIIFLFMYSWDIGIKYKDLRSPQPITMSWPEFLNQIFVIFGGFDDENVHKCFYGEQKEEEKAQNDTKNVQEMPKTETKTSEKEVEKNEEVKAKETQQNQGFDGCCDIATEDEKTEEIEEEIEEKSDEKESEIESGSAEEADSGLQEEYSEDNSAEREAEAEPSGYIQPCNDDPEPVEQLEEQLAAVETEEKKPYEDVIENLRNDIVERIGMVHRTALMKDLDICSWRNIRAKLNNINIDIEQLIKYMDLAEDESEDE